MKHLLLGAAALALLQLPATAQMVLPNLYAKKFCEYAAIGVDLDDARVAAVRDARISSGSPTMVNWKGTMVSSDVLDAVMAVARRCPQYLK